MNSIFHFIITSKIQIALIVTVALFSCTFKRESKIDYLGQKPPGMVAELFAPGLVSTDSMEHSAPAFSPDDSVVLWTVVTSAYRAFLLEMKYEQGKWSAPHRPSFADSTADDYYPSFSSDGKKLHFSSRRKAPSAYPQNIDMRIWEVERTAMGWGNPVPFDTTASQGHEYAHSITRNGTIYFTSPHGGGTSLNIHKAEKKSGRYTKPVLLPYSINSVGYEDGSFIAPDESYLIFESNRPEGIEGGIDLYISFKTKDGRWGIPVNMGPEINSGKAERFARLSPDGKYLFFGSSRNQSAKNIGFDIYWIDAKVIDELKNDETAKTIIERPLGDEVINALYKNDVEGSAGLLKQWLGLYPQSLDATVIYSSTLRKQKQYSEAEQLLTNNASQWNENTTIITEKALVNFGLNKDDEAIRLLAPILVEGDELRERYIYLSGSLLDMAKFKTSDEYFEKAMAISSNGYEYLRRAARFIFINEKDKAFEALNKALAFGYMTRNDFENNTGLASLRPDARWKVLLGKLK